MDEHQREKEALLEKMNDLERQLEAKKAELDLLLKKTRVKESEFSLRELIAEKDSLQQTMESSVRDHMKRIFNEQEKLKFELETKMRDLQARRLELIVKDLEQNAVENCSLQATAEELWKADEEVMMLAEKQKREKEALVEKLNYLEKELEAKQAMELEIEKLRVEGNVMKHIGEGGDLEMVKKVELLLEEISEMEDVLNVAALEYDLSCRRKP